MSFKKFLLIALISISLVFAGAFFYYYTHPKTAASLAGRIITRIVGVSVDIAQLSYSFRPLQISAKNITATPVSDATGFSLIIPELEAHMALEGPFGSRSLVVDSIQVTGFSFTYRQADFSRFSKPESTVFTSKSIIMRLVAFFFFNDIRINEVALTEGRVSAAINGSTLTAERINARRSAEKQIEISADSLFLWPANKTTIRMPNFHLSFKDDVSLSDPIVKGRIIAKQATIEHPDINLSHVDLQAEGIYDISKGQLTSSAFSVSAGDYLALNGALAARIGPQPEAELSFQKAYLLPGKIIPLLPERLKSRLPTFDLTGQISADGTGKITKKETGWDWNSRLNVQFSKNRFNFVTGKRRLHGWITGDVIITGDDSTVDLSGDFILKNMRVSDPGRSFDLPESKISLTGRHPVYRIRNTSAKISRINGFPSLKKIPLEDISLKVTEGIFNLKDASYRLSGVHLHTPMIKNVTANITADPKTVRIQVKGKSTGILPVVHTLKLLPPGWQFTADDTMRIDATLKPPGTLSFASLIRFKKMSIQDPGARFMGENLGADLRVDGMVNLSEASVAGSVGLKLTDGEILYDLYYVDIKRNPISVSGQSVYTSGSRSVEINDLNFTLENAVSLDVRGRVELNRSPRLQLALDVQPALLKPIFKLFVADPFQSKKPFLSDIDIGGRMAAHLNVVQTDNAWSVKGRLHWQDGSLDINNKELGLSDIQMEFPIWLETGTVSRDETPMDGNISIGQLNIPPIPEQAIAIRFSATPNGLFVPSSTMIRIPGGSARLAPVTIRDTFSGKISAKTALTVNPTDIAPLLTSVWPAIPKSRLHGTLDPVLIHGDQIETGGTLTWEGFGGNIILSDLWLRRFLSADALIRVTAQLNGLNLGQVTAGTAFGRVDGVLTGFARGLEIAYGQPQAFNLLLETEKKKGIPQKISIKAVDNIARIGGGQSPFMGLAGALTNLFETLNYEKIGIRASLENDVFKINGTVMDQGREYLMKGSVLAGVNIINQNPDNRIRFKDMVKRIKRATAGDAKPVIR